MRTLLALSLLACGLSGARADDAKPATSNVPRAEYPRIHPDHRVTFRLRAPDAKSVKVQPGGADNGLGKGPYEMERADDGIWTVTMPPAVPGFHYYWLVVDGVPVNDPGSETFFGYGKPTSGVEVPEPGVGLYDVKDVPHGEVRSLWYHSKVTGSPRRAFVYTPPGYDADAGRRYPVLYLQHGAGEDERGWTTQGRANFILDNLIAAGKAAPMIVVMDNGYATKVGRGTRAGQGQPAWPADVRLPGLRGGTPRRVDPEDRRDLPHDLRPATTAPWPGSRWARCRRSRSRRPTRTRSPTSARSARRPSALSTRRPRPTAPSATRRPSTRRSASSGSEPAPARSGSSAAVRKMQESLDHAGIRHVVVFESPGTAHEWQTWRRSLLDFAPRLFRY